MTLAEINTHINSANNAKNIDSTGLLSEALGANVVEGYVSASSSMADVAHSKGSTVYQIQEMLNIDDVQIDNALELSGANTDAVRMLASQIAVNQLQLDFTNEHYWAAISIVYQNIGEIEGASQTKRRECLSTIVTSFEKAGLGEINTGQAGGAVDHGISTAKFENISFHSMALTMNMTMQKFSEVFKINSYNAPILSADMDLNSAASKAGLNMDTFLEKIGLSKISIENIANAKGMTNVQNLVNRIKSEIGTQDISEHTTLGEISQKITEQQKQDVQVITLSEVVEIIDASIDHAATALNITTESLAQNLGSKAAGISITVDRTGAFSVGQTKGFDVEIVEERIGDKTISRVVPLTKTKTKYLTQRIFAAIGYDRQNAKNMTNSVITVEYENGNQLMQLESVDRIEASSENGNIIINGYKGENLVRSVQINKKTDATAVSLEKLSVLGITKAIAKERMGLEGDIDYDISDIVLKADAKPKGYESGLIYATFENDGTTFKRYEAVDGTGPAVQKFAEQVNTIIAAFVGVPGMSN